MVYFIILIFIRYFTSYNNLIIVNTSIAYKNKSAFFIEKKN